MCRTFWIGQSVVNLQYLSPTETCEKQGENLVSGASEVDADDITCAPQCTAVRLTTHPPFPASASTPTGTLGCSGTTVHKTLAPRTSRDPADVVCIVSDMGLEPNRTMNGFRRRMTTLPLPLVLNPSCRSSGYLCASKFTRASMERPRHIRDVVVHRFVVPAGSFRGVTGNATFHRGLNPTSHVVVLALVL